MWLRSSPMLGQAGEGEIGAVASASLGQAGEGEVGAVHSPDTLCTGSAPMLVHAASGVATPNAGSRSVVTTWTSPANFANFMTARARSPSPSLPATCRCRAPLTVGGGRAIFSSAGRTAPVDFRVRDDRSPLTRVCAFQSRVLTCGARRPRGRRVRVVRSESSIRSIGSDA